MKGICSTLQFRNLSPQAIVLCEHATPHSEPSSRPIWHGLQAVWGKQPGIVWQHAEVSMVTNTWAYTMAPHTTHGELQGRQLLWYTTEIPEGELMVLYTCKRCCYVFSAYVYHFV